MSTLDTLREALEERADSVALSPDAVDAAVRHGYRVQRRHRIVAGVGVAGMLAVVAISAGLGGDTDPDPGPALPSPSVTDPDPTATELSVGAPPAVPYAVGNVLLAGDVRVEMPGQIDEVTRVGNEWAVSWQTPEIGVQQLDLVSPDGTTREVDRGWINGLASGDKESDIALAWGHAPSIQGGPGTLKVMHWSDMGQEVQPTEPFGARVWGVSGRLVIYSPFGDIEDPPMAWDLDTGETALLLDGLGPRSWFQDLTPDSRIVLIHDDLHQCLSAYDLFDDDRKLWEHCDLGAGMLSPDRQWILNGAAIYTASTGELEQEFELPFDVFGLSRWEDDDNVLISGSRAGDETITAPIVRCEVAAASCEIVPMDGELVPTAGFVFGRP